MTISFDLDIFNDFFLYFFPVRGAITVTSDVTVMGNVLLHQHLKGSRDCL